MRGYCICIMGVDQHVQQVEGGGDGVGVWGWARSRRGETRDRTDLLHNTGLALGKGDMATRLILDELDLDLATLTARLVIIIVVVLGTNATALGTAGISAVAGLLQVIVTRGKLVVDGSHVGHGGKAGRRKRDEKEGEGRERDGMGGKYEDSSPKGEGNRRYPIE